MLRLLKAAAGFMALAAFAFAMFCMGDAVAAESAPKQLSTNAFLFLAGLGGAIVLLSPASFTRRYRLR